MSEDNIISTRGANDQALVVPDFSPQNRPKKQPKTVLEEEDYVEKLEAIIERNYYPELPQLRADLGIENKATTDPSTLPKTIGKFLNKFTSEDNESFEQLVEADKRRDRINNPWLYKDERAISEGSHEQLALPSISNQAVIESSTEVKEAIAWPYKNKNSLMYYPEGLEQQAQAGPSVALENTRVSSDLLEKQASFVPADSGSDDTRLDINGFYLIPPTPSPQVSATPLHPSTPQFKLGEISSREKLALSMTEQRSKKNRKTHEAITPLLTPYHRISRLSHLSPAAQLLGKKGLLSSDPALLASYTPKLGSFTPTPRATSSPFIVTPDVGTSTQSNNRRKC